MLFYIQLTIQVSDGRDPENTANGTITVSITRDESRPSFQNTPYNDATVSENLPSGRVFYNNVRATDQDLQVHVHAYYHTLEAGDEGL